MGLIQVAPFKAQSRDVDELDKEEHCSKVARSFVKVNELQSEVDTKAQHDQGIDTIHQ